MEDTEKWVHRAVMGLVANRLRQDQIRFGFVGKEVSDVSGSGEQDRGGFIHAAVSDL